MVARNNWLSLDEATLTVHGLRYKGEGVVSGFIQMQKLLVVLSPLFLLSACTSISLSLENKSYAFVNYSVCAEFKSAEKFASGVAVEESIEAGLDSCSSEEKNFLTIIESELKKDNGWKSLHPTVRPELSKHLRSEMKIYLSSKFTKLRRP